MCLAEKYVTILWGLWGFYWPLTNGEWRVDYADAERDIAEDAALSATLPGTTYYREAPLVPERGHLIPTPTTPPRPSKK